MTPSLKFFPSALLNALGRDGARSVSVTLRGTCLFADVSGFTAMSEALLGMGKEGSEVLTRVLNGFYSRVVRTVLSRGGDVMRFAGDAVTAHFPDEAQAVAAAHAMQAIMPDFAEIQTPAGAFPLKMKAGLASGAAVFFTVGDDRQMDYVYSGDPVDGAADAEHHAEAGQVVMRSREKFEILNPGPTLVPPPPGGAVALEPDVGMQSFLHPMLWEALSAGHEGLLNEHRHITVLFAAFRPIEEESDAGEGVRAFYLRAAEAVRKMDGYINKVDMGDKGAKLLVLFGAPRAHEDDEARALLCAQGLLAAARETGFSIRMGINAAKVFCGLVGSEERCEYTVMGDGVNAAARLMQAAPDKDYLVAESIRARTAGEFSFRALPSLMLKGKKNPFPVYKCEGQRRDELEELAFFVGRGTEMAEFQGAIRAQPVNQAKLFWIHGEAGIGKTAFIRHFLRSQLDGAMVFWHRCTSHGAISPYAGLRPLVAGLIEAYPVVAAQSLEEKARSIIEKKDVEMSDFLPILLNAFLLARQPLAEPVLEPEVRRALLWKLTSLVVNSTDRSKPLFLVLDGAQWLDEESKGLLLHLAQTVEWGGFRVLVGTRENPPQEVATWLQVIELKRFNRVVIEDFMAHSLGVPKVPDEAVTKVLDASKGVPLLVQETLSLLFKTGYLSRDEEYPQVILVDESRSVDLPDTLAGLMLSRIDTLPVAKKNALRILSVAGETISVPIAEALSLSSSMLHELAGEGEFLWWDKEHGLYVFLQGHMVAALYESLEFGHRRALHLKIAMCLLADCHDPSQIPHHLLAHHFSRAGSPKAIPHLREVARQAQAAYAVQDAIRAFEEVVALLGDEEAVPSGLVLDLSRLYLLSGRPDDASRLIEKQIELLKGEHLSAALRLIADAYAAKGQFPLADQALDKSLAVASTPREKFLTLCALGKLYGKTGRLDKARGIIAEVDEQCREFEDDKEYQMNRMRLGFIQYQLGQPEKTLQMFAGLQDFFEKRGHIIEAYTLLNNRGHMLCLQGNDQESLQLFKRALEIVKKYGIWETEAQIKLYTNIGNGHLNLGEWSEAEHFLTMAYAYAKRNSSSFMDKPLFLLGELETCRGNLAQALAFLNESYAFSVSKSQPVQEVLEELMKVALILNDRIGYERTLREYETVVQNDRLACLHAELMCYRSEGALAFGRSDDWIDRMIDTLQECEAEENHEAGYRAARFLFRATQSAVYLEKMQQALGVIKRREYLVECRYLECANEPEPDRLKTLWLVIEQYPYAQIAWQAYLLLAQNTSNKSDRGRALGMALSVCDKITAGLAADLVVSFKRRSLYLTLLDLVRSARSN